MLPDSINFQRLTPIIALISHLDMDPDSPLTTTDIRSSLKFAYPSPRAWPISCSVICSISLKPKILPKALLEILILTLVMKPFSSKLLIDWPAVTALLSVCQADVVTPSKLPSIFCAVELKFTSMSSLTLVDASVIFIGFSLMFHLSTALLTACCSPASAPIILYVRVPFASL